MVERLKTISHQLRILAAGEVILGEEVYYQYEVGLTDPITGYLSQYYKVRVYLINNLRTRYQSSYSYYPVYLQYTGQR